MIYWVNASKRGGMKGVFQGLAGRSAHGLIKMFHRNSGAPPETLPNIKYDAPREVCGDRK